MWSLQCETLSITVTVATPSSSLFGSKPGRVPQTGFSVRIHAAEKQMESLTLTATVRSCQDAA